MQKKMWKTGSLLCKPFFFLLLLIFASYLDVKAMEEVKKKLIFRLTVEPFLLTKQTFDKHLTNIFWNQSRFKGFLIF